jgi:polar amino acid transport system substrate-binding protein
MKPNCVSAALLCMALAACAATAPTVSTTAKSELAPQGRVRVAILDTNPLYVTQSTASGDMQGLVPDISRAFAAQLGAELQHVRYPSAAALLGAAKRGEWDVAFIGYAPERSADMDFTPVMVNGENSYVVREASPLKAVADVDRPGVRIAVSERTVQHGFLKGNIRHATLVPMANNDASMQAFAAGSVDAVAGNRMTVLESSAANPGTRVLDGSFMQVPYALAIAKGRPAGTAYATQFVEYLKESGMLDASLKRANVNGVTVAREYSPAGGPNVPASAPAKRY